MPTAISTPVALRPLVMTGTEPRNLAGANSSCPQRPPRQDWGTGQGERAGFCRNQTARLVRTAANQVAVVVTGQESGPTPQLGDAHADLAEELAQQRQA